MTSWAISPLRYPGGKGALAPFLGRLLEVQFPRCEVYVEPFAGGAGAALRLLYDEYVREIVLNDINPGVAAFWRAVFLHTHDLIDCVRSASLTVEAWREQQAIYRNPEGVDDVALGFATFYLNRTNRSGILDAWPIGGLEQGGLWKIDARFNREVLARKISELGRYRNRVTVLQEDGIRLASRMLNQRHFIYADPPYLQKGSDLYVDAVGWLDHLRLADTLSTGSGRWMVTYDHDPRVYKLYPRCRAAQFSVAHRARSYRIGTEVAIFAPQVRGIDLAGLGSNARFVQLADLGPGSQWRSAAAADQP